MNVVVFPGQGSQAKGMGAELFDEYADLTVQADEIVGYSIKDLCLYDEGNRLKETQYTQPALYVVNALLYLKKEAALKGRIAYLAGHSLGEYSALFAAGVFDFATGLRLVQKRGELMSKATGGGMAAVIGLEDDRVRELLHEHKMETISIANYNAPGQVVIAGKKEDVLQAQNIFEESGASMYIPLKVSGAFHSPYMKEAASEFASFIERFTFEKPELPVISNVTARPYAATEIKQNLVEQMAAPVLWTKSIHYLMDKGDFEFEEVGPGNVLQGLISKIRKHYQPPADTRKQDAGNASPGKQDLQTSSSADIKVTPESLGNEEFKRDYAVRYAYVAGGMYMGIASKEMVVAMGKAGMLGYYGTGGVKIEEVASSIAYIQEKLGKEGVYGINVTYNSAEEALMRLLLESGVKNIEAAGYMQITPALVKYRLKGLKKEAGVVRATHRIMAKLSRPEVAELFCSPAPEAMVRKLLEQHEITPEQADMARQLPMADDICAEADSGGHTDLGSAYSLTPAIVQLKNEMMQKYAYARNIRVGAAGGIGTPEAALAAFMLGADFIVTGSINQCTVEAATSNSVKNILEQINVQDTEYAPAGDNMFEFGAKVQVVRKGLFFPVRANKLYALYQQYNSIDEIDAKTRKQLQEKYFQRSFDEIFEECRGYYAPEIIAKAEKNPKQKMVIIFKWYFGTATRLALAGKEERIVDYQINCGPALGAFNQWVKGTELESWKNRHVAAIGTYLMESTAEIVNRRINALIAKQT